MGIKTVIELEEVNTLFPEYNFTNLAPTLNGIMDTTYIVQNRTSAYILKKYEREMGTKIETDKLLLQLLCANGLNTSRFLCQKSGWYLYTKLIGESPKSITLMQIQALARFMASFHNVSQNFRSAEAFLNSYNIVKMLDFTKKSYFFYYKKLASLKELQQEKEGFIHGDIFRDNTLFDGKKIVLFDFIDGGLGEFSFDVAVALLSFNPKRRALYEKSFLQTYNQNRRKKISNIELQEQLQKAIQFYTLLRINHDKSIRRIKELANFR